MLDEVLNVNLDGCVKRENQTFECVDPEITTIYDGNETELTDMDLLPFTRTFA